MKTTLTVFIVIVLQSFPCLILSAPNDPDFQLRTLAHLQISDINGHGLAGWLIAPDLTKTEPFRLLAVGGYLVKENENWQEFMAGALFGMDGSIQPALNFRSYSVFPKAKRLDFYSGLMLRTDRGIADSYITYPAGKFRFGLETELTAGLKSGIKSDARLGLRLSFKIPWANRPIVATSVMPGIRGDTVIRTYLLFNF